MIISTERMFDPRSTDRYVEPKTLIKEKLKRKLADSLAEKIVETAVFKETTQSNGFELLEMKACYLDGEAMYEFERYIQNLVEEKVLTLKEGTTIIQLVTI